ncbi:hypothetical protein F4823DRAFT_629086 [Ustulina deusta]|nr:hypothetical protein F4823DRAFT_629086 [Ustulina deusta]
MGLSRYVDTGPAPAPELVDKGEKWQVCNLIEFLGPYNLGQMRNVYPHIKMFSEGLQIKRTRQGKLYSRSDFDNWMWNYDVLAVVPCFPTEKIVQAYPDAKSILTVREPEAWAKSIWNTVSLRNVSAQSFPWNFFKYFVTTDLNARAKALVPADLLLICPFLGVNVLTTPYPHMNDTKQFQARSMKITQRGRSKAISLMRGQWALLPLASGT